MQGAETPDIDEQNQVQENTNCQTDIVLDRISSGSDDASQSVM